MTNFETSVATETPADELLHVPGETEREAYLRFAAAWNEGRCEIVPSEAMRLWRKRRPDEFERFNIDHEPMNDLQVIEAEDREQDETREAYEDAVAMASFGLGY